MTNSAILFATGVKQMRNGACVVCARVQLVNGCDTSDTEHHDVIRCVVHQQPVPTLQRLSDHSTVPVKLQHECLSSSTELHQPHSKLCREDVKASGLCVNRKRTAACQEGFKLLQLHNSFNQCDRAIIRGVPHWSGHTSCGSSGISGSRCCNVPDTMASHTRAASTCSSVVSIVCSRLCVVDTAAV